jgi:2-polyprenyl-3-methyl-5-hydroxy-6-metoxy-1,4-benzoquinol methylase
MPEEKLDWWHRLPREGPIDRIEALVEAARGRSVVHVGFVDELMAAKQAGGVWLHARLAEVASTLIGLDLDEAGIEAARGQGYEAHAVDAQSVEAVRALGLPRAEVVIAGELIEHLDAPGPFLRAMHELADELVLTTPNAYRVANFVLPLSGREAVHPHHTAWHSPQTLRRLLEMSGWTTERVAYFHTPVSRRGQPLQNAVRRALRAVNSLLPYWSDGMIVWARKTGHDGS